MGALFAPTASHTVSDCAEQESAPGSNWCLGRTDLAVGTLCVEGVFVVVTAVNPLVINAESFCL